jgi:hypothetical protein
LVTSGEVTGARNRFFGSIRRGKFLGPRPAASGILGPICDVTRLIEAAAGDCKAAVRKAKSRVLYRLLIDRPAGPQTDHLGRARQRPAEVGGVFGTAAGDGHTP